MTVLVVLYAIPVCYTKVTFHSRILALPQSILAVTAFLTNPKLLKCHGLLCNNKVQYNLFLLLFVYSTHLASLHTEYNIRILTNYWAFLNAFIIWLAEINSVSLVIKSSQRLKGSSFSQTTEYST